MKKSEGIELVLEGSFNFSINQHGLNYYDVEELRNAIEDFWAEFERSRENMNLGHDILDIHLDWDEEDIKVFPS